MRSAAIALMLAMPLVAGCDGEAAGTASPAPSPTPTPSPTPSPSPTPTPAPIDDRGVFDSSPIPTVADFDTLTLGGYVSGPHGTHVEASIIADSGEALADIKSSVRCPAAIAVCDPATNPAGTVYTYVIEVTPGVDAANDPGFTTPATVRPIGSTQTVRLEFPSTGFAGTAGWSYTQIAAALSADAAATRVVCHDTGRIDWYIAYGSGWGTGETVTFFWQSSRPPSVDDGEFLASALATDDVQVVGIGATLMPSDVPGELPTASDCSSRN